MDRERFESMYQGPAPWDIPGPQPEFLRLEETGVIRGSVLDAGCGTGENALYLASKGHEVWGVDYVPVAIERARAKAKDRGLDVHFEVGNALELDKLGCQFDTAIDSGLFHTFSDEERVAYVSGLARVVRPGGRVCLMCFSDREPPGEGPRRVSEAEIRDAFRDGWHVESIEPSAFEIRDDPDGPRFSPGGPKAWVVTVARAGG